MSEVSIADIDQAEAALAAAKEAYYGSDKAEEHREAFQEAKRNVVQLRSAWRTQETAAGRRGLVGGDAVATTEEN
jgi:predicted P-loop ATPase